MPLLNGEIFVKKEPPSDLRPDEEVFFSPITYELFRDYDEFFERTIQLNSVGWGCSFCGLQNLNYNEAVACEAGDAARLAEFGPSGLCRGLLHIIVGAKRRRMTDLVDVMLAFAATRYFIGEELCVRNTDSASTAGAGEISLDASVVVEQVVLSPPKPRTQSPSNSSAPVIPDAKSIQYAVRYLPSKNNPTVTPTLRIMSYTSLQRPPHRYLTRDKIKAFARQTVKLDNGIFVPRESVMKYFNLYPHGTLRWSDVFAGPVLPWADYVPPRVITGREKVVITSKDSTNQPVKRPTNGPVLIKSISTSVDPPFVTPSHTVDMSQNKRIERAELERTWSFLRKRDDLDLSDLVPLPPVTPLSLRLPIPPEHFGDCLRVYEFFHVFGGFLHIPVPGAALSVVKGDTSRTSVVMIDSEKPEYGIVENDGFSWSVLEDILFSQDPFGPFADVLYGLLSAIRRLENETASQKLPPTAEAAAASTVSAVATLEAGLPVASSGALTGLGCSQEYTTILADTLTAPSNTKLANIFLATADATRQCELVGLAPVNSALTSRVERAAAQVASPMSEVGGWSCGTGPGSAGRSLAIRASALAVALGAISLPPLDRAGLAETIWLHINTSPAKTGGWRGSIWGGTRPLDDPCVDLMRINKDLVDKLRSEPLYGWPLGDRLRLLSCLIDEVMLQPQVRELLDTASEDIRNLRLSLRSVQAERFRFYGGMANIANMLYGFSPSTLVSTCDHWLTGTPPILRNSANRPRKKTIEAAKAKIAKEFNEARAAVTGQRLSGSDLFRMPPIADICAHLDKEEEALWRSVVRKARRFSIIPLGQDRIYRRYWLVPSLPAVLIENTVGETDTAPPVHLASPTKSLSGSSQSKPSLRVRGRQVDPGCGALGSSPAEALRNLRQAAKEMRAAAEAEDEHWQNPRILDRDSLVSQLAVDLPANRENLTNEEFKALVHPNRRNNAQVDANHPVVKQVEELQRNPPKWSILLPLPPSEEDDEEENNHSADDKYAGARRAVDQLEASLNPRGIRESHLRKSVSQLRPILISTVAQCPVDILSVPEGKKEKANSLPTKDPQEILLAWLETAVRGVAMRLGIPFAKIEHAAKGAKMREDLKEMDSNDLGDDTRHKQKLNQLAQLILALGKTIGPRRLAAPLSADDRSLRGALPSTTSLVSLDENNPPSPQSTSPQLSETPSTSGATTGFQRWCTYVRSATTTAQLHLLLRSLERSARKANRGGRGVPAAIGSYATRFQLPEIRCTACRGVPDSAAASSHNHRGISPLTICGGCACPFHPDCLLNCLSRQSSRSSLRNSTKSALPRGSTPDPDIINALSTTYSLMACHINTTAAARQDTLKGALLLCQRCRRLASAKEGEDTEEIEKFADPLPDEILEVIELQNSVDDEKEIERLDTAEGDNHSASNSNEEQNAEEHEAEKLESDVAEDAEETAMIDRSPSLPSKRVSRPQMAKRGRGRRSIRGSFSLRGTPGLRGRPAKRPRYLEDYEGGDDIDYEPPNSMTIPSTTITIDNNNETAVCTDKSDEDFIFSPTVVVDVEEDRDVPYEDEVQVFTVRRSRGRPRRGGVGLRGVRVSADFGTPRRRGRPPSKRGGAFMLTSTVPSLLNSSHSTVVVEDDSIDDEADQAPEVNDEHDVEMKTRPPEISQNPIHTQADAERLLADISALSAARPLLRCALSKTVQSEMSQTAEGSPPSRRSATRQRRPTIHADGTPSPIKSLSSAGDSELLAYDIESLRELLTQDGLPGGPSQIVSQLRLLTRHWIASNRPGSRLHGCALDVSAFLEKRLQELANLN